MEIVLENFPQEVQVTAAMEEIVKKVLNKVAELYGLEEDAEVGVTLTDNEYIKELNTKYRNKECSTDVLSFALNEGEEPEIVDGPSVNLIGDIIISVETAQMQAEEYGHSLERELAFLTVHGMMHLLGYDHIEEEDRIEMRKEEEYVLGELGIPRK
ncbi:rRNA maturation RNase YbeY [Anaerosinus gibii]|uniref:Endoribonuclease YbeY n=1 Tax=Selenobaculum gibii TaxID=3054208 RepID=A0A9Y2AGY7_9FIRM|nr:rRNA maturation RNase YbeY [Selenobaculum gbiensis]WIW69791.1 rRNA maturation RNase YbeY [Selenobaculum gbiensis]